MPAEPESRICAVKPDGDSPEQKPHLLSLGGKLRSFWAGSSSTPGAVVLSGTACPVAEERKQALCIRRRRKRAVPQVARSLPEEVHQVASSGGERRVGPGARLPRWRHLGCG
ncbi:hypothetical protein MRX96_027420 [Rhipicephalus microplus]